MSLIEESLRRQEDPTIKKATVQPASGARATQTAEAPPAAKPAQAWAPTRPVQSSSSAEGIRISSLLLVAAMALVAVAGWKVWAARDQWLPARSSAEQPAQATSPLVKTPAAPVSQAASAPAPRSRERDSRAPILQGVVLGGESPYALINGGIFRVGDALGDATISGIEPRHVILDRKDGSRISLAMKD